MFIFNLLIFRGGDNKFFRFGWFDKKDADERIFKSFGFIYGVVVRFKYEFLKFFFTDLVDKFLVISFRLKLIMGVMFGFDFDMKRMYLFKYVISIFWNILL